MGQVLTLYSQAREGKGSDDSIIFAVFGGKGRDDSIMWKGSLEALIH